MPTTPKSEDANQTKDEAEDKESLPVGHDQAGYVRPDLSLERGDNYGKLPPEEKAWHEKRDKAREEEVKAIAEHENEVAKEERKTREEQAEKSAKEFEARQRAAAGDKGSA